MPYHTLPYKPLSMHRAVRYGLNALLVAVGVAWTLPASGDNPCPRVQIERLDDGRNLVRLLEADIPKGHRLYALAMASRDLDPDEWKVLTPDKQSADSRYLSPLEGGWLYLITTPEKWTGREAYAIKPPPEEDTKGAGFFHGPPPRWLELETEPLPGLPKAARVCSLEW